MEDRKELARRIVRESVVLLKNEGQLLPLKENSHVAVFGRAQLDTFVSGNGSGAAHRDGCKCILQACAEQGLCPEEKLSAFYWEQMEAEGEKDPDAFDWSMAGQYINSGIMYEIFGKYHAPKPEPAVPKPLLTEAAERSDTALWILGRNSGGEECDRHLEGDFYLTESERKLVEQICAFFSKVIVVLNVNGLVDLSWTKEYEAIKAVLFLGIPGEEGADALAELLLGKASPCGKLAVTIAEHYEDYPAAWDFTWDKENEGQLKTYESYGLDAAENGSSGYRKSPVTVYREGIYLGYRYFSTFGRICSSIKTSPVKTSFVKSSPVKTPFVKSSLVKTSSVKTSLMKKPLYPFGYGLSYTSFFIRFRNAERRKDRIALTMEVENVGDVSGKETIQAYLSVEDSEIVRPGLELVGFEKTGLLEPGETAACMLEIPWERFACYDEKGAAWVIPAGSYRLLVGNSSENLQEAVSIPVEKCILVRQCRNRLGIRECNRGKLDFLKQDFIAEQMPDLPARQVSGEGPDSTAERNLQCSATVNCSVKEDRISVNGQSLVESEMRDIEHSLGCRDIESLVQKAVEKGQAQKFITATEKYSASFSAFSIEELASLCVGYGPGIPFSAFGDGSDPSTIFDEKGIPLTTNDHSTGFAGYVSPAIAEKGVHSIFYKDGPAGIGQFAWPSEMLTACSFDRELWYAFGDAMGRECEAEWVDIWLAPAMNLIRNPLGGRNFEYFSEDPLLAGICGCEIARGVQGNHPVLVCAKHFAANEQETWRRGSAGKQYDAVDSIVEERTLRELYLRPFEMMVREACLRCIMTSFNKINGTFAAGSRELCTGILREEWGFDGMVITDWGDMDVVADGADAIHAGNDIVMPGGPPVIRQILRGYEEGRVTREDLERSVRRLLHVCAGIGMYDRKPGDNT